MKQINRLTDAVPGVTESGHMVILVLGKPSTHILHMALGKPRIHIFP